MVVFFSGLSVLVWGLNLLGLASGGASESHVAVDIAIVGAGPAGLQWATFLERANVTSYVVLEKGFGAGTFFREYPRARRLISNNKCRSGKGVSADFGLRHDWNSLLGTNLSLCDLTSEFYPNADKLVQYLELVATGLRVEYNATVQGSTFEEGRHVVRLLDGRSWTCNHLVVATGFVPESMPVEARWTRAKEVFTYANFPALDESGRAEFCEDRDLFIIGVGNAAFETANMLAGCAGAIHVFGRRPPRFSALTHYVGDVRMKSFEIADRYLLKSLDSLVTLPQWAGTDSVFSMQKAMDAVIVFAGGFTGKSPQVKGVSQELVPLVSSMNESAKSKFPLTGVFYSDAQVERKWYAGNLMHGRDYRSGAGGFIHGFRYLISAQVNYMLAKHYGRAFPSRRFGDASSLKEHVLSRFQNSSALYQMHGHLRDVVVQDASGDGFLYVEQVPRYWVGEVLALLGVEQLPPCHGEVGFDYGHSKKVPGDWDFDFIFTLEREQQTPPVFLHPVMVAVDAFGSQSHFHTAEDLRTRWTAPDKVRSVMKSADRWMNACFRTSTTSTTAPPPCAGSEGGCPEGHPDL